MSDKYQRISKSDIEYFRNVYKVGSKSDVEEIDVFCDQVLELLKEADRD